MTNTSESDISRPGQEFVAPLQGSNEAADRPMNAQEQEQYADFMKTVASMGHNAEVVPTNQRVDVDAKQYERQLKEQGQYEDILRKIASMGHNAEVVPLDERDDVIDATSGEKPN